MYGHRPLAGKNSFAVLFRSYMLPLSFRNDNVSSN